MTASISVRSTVAPPLAPGSVRRDSNRCHILVTIGVTKVKIKASSGVSRQAETRNAPRMVRLHHGVLSSFVVLIGFAFFAFREENLAQASQLSVFLLFCRGSSPTGTVACGDKYQTCTTVCRRIGMPSTVVSGNVAGRLTVCNISNLSNCHPLYGNKR